MRGFIGWYVRRELKRWRGRFSRHKGDILQWLSAVIVLIGVYCEYKLKADFYYVMITSGALLWGIAQKINHPKKKRSKRRGFWA